MLRERRSGFRRRLLKYICSDAIVDSFALKGNQKMSDRNQERIVKAMPYEVRHEPEDEYDFGYSETRYRLVDVATGEIVDDAQGYGYRTAAGAHRAYGYKSMPKSRKREIASVKSRVRHFREENPTFVDDMEYCMLNACKDGVEYTFKDFRKLLDEEKPDLRELTPEQLFRYI